EYVGGALHRAALRACPRQQLAERLPETQRAVGDGEFRRDDQPSVLQIKQQLPPVVRALARAVGGAEQLLFALRRRSDDHQDALLAVFKTGLQVNAVGPHVNIALGRQIALPPVLVLAEPDPLQPRDSRGRQARCILASSAASASSKSPVEMPFR